MKKTKQSSIKEDNLELRPKDARQMLDGEDGILEIEKNIVSKKSLEGPKETQSTVSITSLVNLEEAILLRTSLIDESTNILFESMKNVAETKNERRFHYQEIKSLCACAKNIKDLLKLKLEVFKEIRK